MSFRLLLLITLLCVCTRVEPYTVREARIHVRHVRDLLKSVDLQDSYNGLNCNSLSLLNIVTGGNILGELLPGVTFSVGCYLGYLVILVEY